MEFGDFNGDGKISSEERARQYYIYSESNKSESGNTQGRNSNKGNDSSGGAHVLLICLMIIIEGAFIQVMPGIGLGILLFLGLGWLLSK